MKKLKEKWSNFIGIIFGPGSVIFVFLTVVSLGSSFYFEENREMSILLAGLGSVFGGIAGIFIKDDYNKSLGENTLEKKGRSAVRNLQSIGKQLQNIRFWVAGFLREKVGEEQKNFLKEIDRHISTAQMNIESGFEDWVDIIPELSEGAERAAEITKKQQEVLRAYVGELLEKKRELVVSTDEKRVDELKKRISILEKQIKEIRSDNNRSLGVSIPLSSTSITGNVPFIVGPSTFGVSGTTTSLGTGYRCKNCGKNMGYGVGMNIYDSYCDECKKEFFGL